MYRINGRLFGQNQGEFHIQSPVWPDIGPSAKAKGDIRRPDIKPNLYSVHPYSLVKSLTFYLAQLRFGKLRLGRRRSARTVRPP